MVELTEDRFFQVLREYPACRVEYFLLKDDRPYAGEESHRRALGFAMGKLAAEEEEPWDADVDAAAAERMDPKGLLAVPDKPWKREQYGTVVFDVSFGGGRIPYWYAFLEPPHGTGPVRKNGKVIRREYGREDVAAVNAALFPEGTEPLTVFDWSTDWSDFFDDGREWWGTGCWTVYDRKLERYAVILASTTD